MEASTVDADALEEFAGGVPAGAAVDVPWPLALPATSKAAPTMRSVR